MPDERLLQYVRTNLAKGFSLSELREGMQKYGYSDKEIDKIFKNVAEEKLMHLEPLPEGNRINWGLYLLILMGFGTLGLLAAFPLIIFSGFGKLGWFVAYPLAIIMGLLFGFLMNYAIGLFNDSRALKTITGIIAPLLAVAAIMGVFFGKGVIIDLALAYGPNPIKETLGSALSPIFLSLVFYLASNVFIIAGIIQKKQERHLFWYPIAAAAYAGLWIFATALVKKLIFAAVKIPTVL